MCTCGARRYSTNWRSSLKYLCLDARYKLATYYISKSKVLYVLPMIIWKIVMGFCLLSRCNAGVA